MIDLAGHLALIRELRTANDALLGQVINATEAQHVYVVAVLLRFSRFGSIMSNHFRVAIATNAPKATDPVAIEYLEAALWILKG